ncbi:MAG: hypothetical protein BWX93_01952 [Bacteroidetes bacterium ADurb.Bin139]|nr:MAG: hypothetical protein BWX93_01952 [Bacteroidetes bacterium ADurb.Bin139]
MRNAVLLKMPEDLGGVINILKAVIYSREDMGMNFATVG